ncbi:DUF4832 domain-containing protein [Calothrix sp. PCC 6303]|uniref:DUF4832 domain-containing protein n=1 Tax=Calothrix sp. PCC 6303 TaxID=1170562 RepID=UPI0002A00AB3|nr:DUF4832 domain-containing protein [Calothrix sp. PCC 6303]AFZ00157.1 hypothetical protein Cal6303_1094 [Calothrix sp. PCC 6303]
MKLERYIQCLILMFLVILFAYQTILPTGASTSITTYYEVSDENFENPERGFYVSFDPLENDQKDKVYPLNLIDLQKIKQDRISLIKRIYLLSEFRDKQISENYLTMISNDCNLSRQAGLKMIIRFSYNWLEDNADAPKDIILSHIEQLKPILQKNYDVIAYMEAGFIGRWGEWHSSTNGLDQDISIKREILLKILAVLPSQRMVAIRYPHDKTDIFQNNNNLTEEEALNLSNRARVGFHNDCFLADIDDGGTYKSIDSFEIAQQKKFLNKENMYVLQGGEVCTLTSTDHTGKYYDCSNALRELEQMRWSTLNTSIKDGKEIFNKWKLQGCIDTISKKLGYRFNLLSSTITQKSNPGGIFSIKLEINNSGWASPYNQHQIEIILRNIETQDEYYLVIEQNLGTWIHNQKKTIDITAGIPESINTGSYQVLLNLPDMSPKLYKRPEYSIRFANKDVWENSTGYNSLLHTVTVDFNKNNTYSGQYFFKPR